MAANILEVKARLCPSNLNTRPVESVFDGKNAFVWLPIRFEKSICLLFMFDKKLGRYNSLVVVVHHYLHHLSPMSAAHICTSDKCVEAD